MKVLDKETKFAHFGKPGSNFSKGFERRLQKVLKQVDLNDKIILDQACGLGVWMHRFSDFTDIKNIYGFDIDQDLLAEFNKINKNNPVERQIPPQNIIKSGAEELIFESNMFDIVFSNEVFEHFVDDIQAAEEAFRVLKPGGKLIIFTPNRGWPFETHGMFLNGTYIWGNIPFLPWMPDPIRKRLAPHVRNYSNNEIKNILDSCGFHIVHHSHVFPAFDKLEKRLGWFGKTMQNIFHALEKTPLHFFGISHFIVAEKKIIRSN